tara:strand:+ start:9727 stop:10443 length:717 start_codon:yes stop_codon:yes gene_type:complete
MKYFIILFGLGLLPLSAKANTCQDVFRGKTTKWATIKDFFNDNKGLYDKTNDATTFYLGGHLKIKTSSRKIYDSKPFDVIEAEIPYASLNFQFFTKKPVAIGNQWQSMPGLRVMTEASWGKFEFEVNDSHNINQASPFKESMKRDLEILKKEYDGIADLNAHTSITALEQKLSGAWEIRREDNLLIISGFEGSRSLEILLRRDPESGNIVSAYAVEKNTIETDLGKIAEESILDYSFK